MPDEMAFGVMRLIAEGAGQDDADAVGNLRAQAVASYLKLLSKPSLPDVLLKACSCQNSVKPLYRYLMRSCRPS